MVSPGLKDYSRFLPSPANPYALVDGDYLPLVLALSCRSGSHGHGRLMREGAPVVDSPDGIYVVESLRRSMR
jgi:hypothetical protein